MRFMSEQGAPSTASACTILESIQKEPKPVGQQRSRAGSIHVGIVNASARVSNGRFGDKAVTFVRSIAAPPPPQTPPTALWCWLTHPKVQMDFRKDMLRHRRSRAKSSVKQQNLRCRHRFPPSAQSAPLMMKSAPQSTKRTMPQLPAQLWNIRSSPHRPCTDQAEQHGSSLRGAG